MMLPRNRHRNITMVATTRKTRAVLEQEQQGRRSTSAMQKRKIAEERDRLDNKGKPGKKTRGTSSRYTKGADQDKELPSSSSQGVPAVLEQLSSSLRKGSSKKVASQQERTSSGDNTIKQGSSKSASSSSSSSKVVGNEDHEGELYENAKQICIPQDMWDEKNTSIFNNGVGGDGQFQGEQGRMPPLSQQTGRQRPNQGVVGDCGTPRTQLDDFTRLFHRVTPGQQGNEDQDLSEDDMHHFENDEDMDYYYPHEGQDTNQEYPSGLFSLGTTHVNEQATRTHSDVLGTHVNEQATTRTHSDALGTHVNEQATRTHSVAPFARNTSNHPASARGGYQDQSYSLGTHVNEQATRTTHSVAPFARNTSNHPGASSIDEYANADDQMTSKKQYHHAGDQRQKVAGTQRVIHPLQGQVVAGRKKKGTLDPIQEQARMKDENIKKLENVVSFLYVSKNIQENVDPHTECRLRDVVREVIFPNVKFCAGEGMTFNNKKKVDKCMLMVVPSDANEERNQEDGMNMISAREIVKTHSEINFWDKNHSGFGYGNKILKEMGWQDLNMEAKVAKWKTYNDLVLKEIRNERAKINHKIRSLLMSSK